MFLVGALIQVDSLHVSDCSEMVRECPLRLYVLAYFSPGLMFEHRYHCLHQGYVSKDLYVVQAATLGVYSRPSLVPV